MNVHGQTDDEVTVGTSPITVVVYPTEINNNPITFQGSCQVTGPAPSGSPPYALQFAAYYDSPANAGTPTPQVTASGYSFENPGWQPPGSGPSDCPLAGYVTTEVTPWPTDVLITVTLEYAPNPRP